MSGFPYRCRKKASAKPCNFGGCSRPLSCDFADLARRWHGLQSFLGMSQVRLPTSATDAETAAIAERLGVSVSSVEIARFDAWANDYKRNQAQRKPEANPATMPQYSGGKGKVNHGETIC